MWPGPAISLHKVLKGEESIALHVSQTSFPFIAGLSDPTISELYIQQRISKPRPALAICTYAATLDGKLTLTVRGPKTNMYPGRLYGQGGNPKYVDTDIARHQSTEISDEICCRLLTMSNMEFMGIVIDNEGFPGKPDLVGHVSAYLESGEIQERVKRRTYNNRPNDAVDITFAPASEGGLFDYLAKETHPEQYCLPAHGGLVLYGHHKFGEGWSQELLKKFE